MALLPILASLMIVTSCSQKVHERKIHTFASKLFHFKNGNWTPVDIDGEYEVSNRGVLWTVDRDGNLSRLDSERWTHSGGGQFRPPKDRLAVGMHHLALQEDEVWTATEHGAARFNGKSWRVYEGILKTDWPTDMAAGRSGVWIIDFYGNLSHFDGTNWTVRSLNAISSAPPPPGWDYWLDADEPARLTVTGDGRLWIYWHGLWRQEGEGWREIPLTSFDSNRALLIGRDEDSVWFRSENVDIVSVKADGTVKASYSPSEMGISKESEIRSLAVVGDRIWVASSGGLLIFDGQRWKNLGHPLDYTWIVGVKAAPDGSAWVLGAKELP